MNPLAWFLILVGVLVLVVGFQGKQDALLSAIVGKDVAIGHPLFLGRRIDRGSAAPTDTPPVPQGTVYA